MANIRREGAHGQVSGARPRIDLQPPARSRFALRELPSWLTSAVIHMAVMLVLGLIYLPVSPHVFVHEMVASLSGAETSSADAGQAQAVQPRVQIDPASDPPQPAAKAGTSTSESAAQPARQAEPDRGEGLPASTIETNDPRTASIQPSRLKSLPPQPVSLPGPSDEAVRLAGQGRVNEHDDVVARFIQYDIGNLTGRDGERAKLDFDRLGDAAVPALVRGLNRSAGIADSCPVLTISKKLDHLLKQTDDDYAILYALENVGRGIHPRASHWQTIIARRNEWEKRYGPRVAGLRAKLAEQLKPQRTLEAGGPFTEADADELALAVTHPDESIRREALRAIAQRGMAFGDGERFEMSQPLIRQLEDDDAAVRHSAREALIALAGSEDIGPSRESLDLDPAAAARWWRDRWTQFRITQKLARGLVPQTIVALQSTDPAKRRKGLAALVGRRPSLSPRQQVVAARSLIDMLSESDERIVGQARSALEWLSGRKIDLPDDPTAEDRAEEARRWTQYWEEVERVRLLEPRAKSLLSMARALEDRGATEEASRYYEKIVRDYPRTSAAAAARQKMKEQ